MSQTKILIVEDDDDDFVLTLDYLEEMSFIDIDVTRAVNAPLAFECIEEGTFDLCLLDFQLGAVNGLEFLKQARDSGFTAPIIMLTGQVDNELDESALDAGADDYLVKDELSTSRFARAIRYALARRDIEKERVERLKAESESRSKNKFLAHLSHELRTPLTAILGYTELLLNDSNRENSRVELEVILRNGRHLLSLLNDVLDLSKVEMNKLELSPSIVQVDSLVADVYTLMCVVAHDKGLVLNVSCDEIPLEITADPTRIRQILINLINNAIKFTDEGEVALHVYGEYCEKSGKKLFCVDVADTGVGIPEDSLTKIFKPFEQVADVVLKNVGGSGLGLAISRELAQRMGGDISVCSQLGKGSRFTLRINPGNMENTPTAKIDFSAIKPTYNKSLKLQLQGKVLVVDDLRDIRNLVGYMIQSTGAEVSFATDGKQAVSKIQQAVAKDQPFDLIYMDIHMPNMDGREAIKIIRQLNITVPIVALTAASMKGADRKLIELGFTEVLSKPIDRDRLNVSQAKYLASRHMVGQSQNPISFLILEDDKDAADAISMLVEGLGAQTLVAYDVQDAKKKINNHSIDALLSDLHIGAQSGLQVIDEFKKIKPDSYIALLTGDSPSTDVLKQHGINKLLKKPIQLADLKTLIADVTHASRASR